MIKKFCCFLLLCSMFFLQTAFAATTGVTVTPGAQLYLEDRFLVDVNITFEDTSLYSEQVYLAYRIVDQSGELVVTESPRTPITLKEDGTAFVTVEVSAVAVPELLNIESGELIFDFVDQENEYWFSDRDLVEYVGEPVMFERAKLGTGLVQEEGTQPVEPTEQEQPEQTTEQSVTAAIDPISMILNVLMWGCIVFVLLKSGRLKKKLETQPQEVKIVSNRLEFIGLLRALACITVVWAHYVCMFAVNGVNGVFPYILPKQQPTSTMLRDFVVSTTDAISINAGSLEAVPNFV